MQLIDFANELFDLLDRSHAFHIFLRPIFDQS